MYSSINRRIDSTKKVSRKVCTLYIYIIQMYINMRCPCAYPHVGNLACDVPEESSSYSVMISGLHTNPEGFKCRSWWYIDPNRSNMTSPQTKRSTHPRMMYIYIYKSYWILHRNGLFLTLHDDPFALALQVLAERHAKIMCLGEWSDDETPRALQGKVGPGTFHTVDPLPSRSINIL